MRPEETNNKFYKMCTNVLNFFTIIRMKKMLIFIADFIAELIHVTENVTVIVKKEMANHKYSISLWG